MSIKLVFASLILLFLFGPVAVAGEYQLTTRQLPNGEYEAVINYDTDIFCFVTVSPASSVEIVGFEVLIESPEHAIPPICIEPIPPIQYYEEVAHIGSLDPGQYTVYWTQPRAFTLSTTLRVGDARIPSSSAWSISVIILSILAIAFPILRCKP